MKQGQSLRVDLPEAAAAEPEPEAIPLRIVYEDKDVIVIDKPPGLVVHPGAGNETGTLVNALLAHCGASLSGIGGVKRPGIVHRLDKDTSGLLVVAKNDQAHHGLSEQFAAHGRDGRLERSYLAIVWGVPERRHGTIATGIDRSTANRQKMAVSRSAHAREAVTHYEVLETFGTPPWRAWSAAIWRPAGPTRSGFTWPISATPCWAMPPMAPGIVRPPENCPIGHVRPLKPWGGNPYMPQLWVSSIPGPASQSATKALRQMTFLRFSRPCD